MKKNILFLIFTAISLFFCLTSKVYAQQDKKPPTTFIMIHFEAGGDRNFYIFQDILKSKLNESPEHLTTRSLSYQKALWPTAVKLVELANSYSIKLALTFTPQWAEYILQDEEKIQIVQQWKNTGHEIAFQHHGINHIDWDGYTNRFQGIKYKGDLKYIKKYESSNYRGAMSQGFTWLQKLNQKLTGDDKVITGTVTDTAIDKPTDIKILTTGGKNIDNDLISIPRSQKIKEGEIFWLSHALLISNFNPSFNSQLYSKQDNFTKSKELLAKFKTKSNKAEKKEIIGVVFHVFDFYRFPDIYEDWFKFISNRGFKIKIPKMIIKDYLDDRENIY